MEEIWKLTIKLNECYRAAGSKDKANEICKNYHDDLKNLIQSKDAEPDRAFISTWINYHSNLII
jgi:hypothetical protein